MSPSRHARRSRRDEVAALARAFNETGRSVRAHLMEVHTQEETLRGYVANTTLGLAIAAESLKRLGLVLSFHRPPDGGLRAEIRRASE